MIMTEETENEDHKFESSNNSHITFCKRFGNTKRGNYLLWEDYFISMSFLAAMRSKDPNIQVGACIVNENKRIVGMGYNGFPRGCSNDKFPWTRNSENLLDSKYLFVCHAEANAILNKNSFDLKRCTLYVALFPCNECAKLIIQSGIKKIIYVSDKEIHTTSRISSKMMFDAANINYKRYRPSCDRLAIDFTKINLKQVDQLPPSPERRQKSQVDSNGIQAASEPCNCDSPLIKKDEVENICDKIEVDLSLSNTSGKRQSYLSTDDYFMAIATLSAMRSKDPATQVGACIVNEDKVVVGIGYNGFPHGCSDDVFPWLKNHPDELQSKFLYVVHAEANAILNRNSYDLKNCTIYVALFPCNECAKLIIQSGIKNVLFLSDKHAHKKGTIAAKKMFDAARINYRQHIPTKLVIELDFLYFEMKK